MALAGPEFFLDRQARLRAAMAESDLDALLISSLPNITYLSGLSASAALAVVTSDRLWLISDGRYGSPLRERAAALTGLEAREVAGDGTYESTAAAVLGEAGVVRVGFESEHLSVRRFRWLESAGPRLEWVEACEMVELLRAIKDRWEVATLREAAARLSDAAKCILTNALAGMTEREVAARVEQELSRVGFSKPAFDTIVASGPNAALPHHRAGTRRIALGDLVVLDFGGMWQGYAVDLSRTVAVGRATARQRAWIEAVAVAQDAAVSEIRPGAAPEDVDLAARRSLDTAGLAEYFTHSTGHGLGLESTSCPALDAGGRGLRSGRWRPEWSRPSSPASTWLGRVACGLRTTCW
jgi:Xaa-Pro aminopeptidase